jgi:hypothetical protein
MKLEDRIVKIKNDWLPRESNEPFKYCWPRNADGSVDEHGIVLTRSYDVRDSSSAASYVRNRLGHPHARFVQELHEPLVGEGHQINRDPL